MNKRGLVLVAALAFPYVAMALGPHEVLVIANDKSADSVQVAKEYIRLRQIPEVNLVRVSVALSDSGVPEQISPETFTRQIWEPAVRAMRERGIGDHILAWVYSVDFPTRISIGGSSDADISVQGLTFLRNKLPDPSAVSSGLYASPFFTGPNNPASASYLSQTFDLYTEWLGKDMPLPCMMLGHTGRNGADVTVIMKCLENGLYSDGTMPTGTIYFVTSGDIRSQARQWQYPAVQKRLAEMGVKAVITDKFPTGKQNVMGVMMGAATVDVDRSNRYLPGCMADHFTSAAGVFDGDGQTKLSEWIKAGATASAGAVTEPYALWMKFPHAQFFVHYASGCTMIESFYQAIKCPLQMVLVGDPLAQPWAPKATLTVSGLTGETVSGKVKLQAAVKFAAGASFGKYIYLLDGKSLWKGKSVALDTSKIKDGEHTLRVVAYRTGEVRSQAFVEKKIVVANGQKAIGGDQSSSAAGVVAKQAAKNVDTERPAISEKTVSQAKAATPANEEKEEKKATAEPVASTNALGGGMELEGTGRR